MRRLKIHKFLDLNSLVKLECATAPGALQDGEGRRHQQTKSELNRQKKKNEDKQNMLIIYLETKQPATY